MNIKQFILQNENGEQQLYNIVTIVNVEKTNSLYLVYTEGENSNELLFAKISNEGDRLMLDNITSDEEILEIEKKINERLIENE